MNDSQTTKAKRRPGLIELITLLATVIPCCLVSIAFLGIERVQDILSVGRPGAQPTWTPTIIEPTQLMEIPATTPTQMLTTHIQSGDFEVTGVWVGQFNDTGFNEISDYMLDLSQNGSNISGTATAVSPGNPNCYSIRPVRGQMDLAAWTLVLTETSGGMTTCPTFPRGSAGDIKTFNLAYDTTDGIPALRGVWQKIYSNSWDVPGEIMFYQQP